MKGLKKVSGDAIRVVVQERDRGRDRLDIDSTKSVRWRCYSLALTALLCVAPDTTRIAHGTDQAKRGGESITAVNAADEQAAVDKYLANLNALLEARIIPGLRLGIVNVAASRPQSFTVEVTEGPSPYSLGAKVGPDGSLSAQISVGYTAMHDAALDAVALSAVLRRPKDLERYLLYQLFVAHANYWHRARSEPTQHAMNFAEFAGIDPKVAQAAYAQREWRQERDRVQVDSLGWVVAYLLVRADPKLAGSTSFANTRDGVGAARLTAASGWFPVPPFATALELAEIVRGPADEWDQRALLCSAARLMEGGITALHGDAHWEQRLKQDTALRSRVADIKSQITELQDSSSCKAAHGAET